MKSLNCALALSLFFTGSAAAQSEPLPFNPLHGHHLVDLTHPLDSDFPYIPVPGVTFPFELQPIATLETAGVAANAWRIHEHQGTQIDAPNHFAPGGVGLDALGPQDLVVPIVVIDFRSEAAADRDAVLTVEQVLAWEAVHGRIPERAVVALWTGWDSRIGDPRYIGLDDEGVKHFPGIGPEAAIFLVEERMAWGVAVDTLSFDPGPDHTYASHRALLGRGRWALEAVANLGRLPPRGATLFIGAPRVRDATGGPTRLIALVPGAAPTSVNLDGIWESIGPEPLGTVARQSFLTRRFTFSADRWEIQFTVSADIEARQLILQGRNAGRFRLGAPLATSDGFEADFIFDERSLTAPTAQTAAALTAAGCGDGGPWTVGETRSVYEDGCAAFRVPGAAACPSEYDVVRQRDNRLYLGARPTAGDLCRSDRRPERSGEAGLIKVQASTGTGR